MSPFGKPRASQRFGIYRFETNAPPQDEPTLLADAATLGEALQWVTRNYGRLMGGERRRGKGEGAVGVEIFDWQDGSIWQRTRIA